jgi:hypothetical protein
MILRKIFEFISTGANIRFFSLLSKIIIYLKLYSYCTGYLYFFFFYQRSS